ncbi:hypothetical protein W822_11225 [Advenella kashmirensis W13003]|uniref:Uncharacterized protein n=1 Tax=Advenella kashmirensis W13003 TaxID=1424334 RepID=V8QX09_9BURK|nr:hypothetical protein [Advenella kashmirensis]ETF03524.1 hypothetical protein W822_11225 [Advenella kashmirensis W13003]
MDIWAWFIGLLMVIVVVAAFFLAPSDREREPLYVRQIVAAVFAFCAAIVCSSLFHLSPSETEGAEIAFVIISVIVMVLISCWYACRGRKKSRQN